MGKPRATQPWGRGDIRGLALDTIGWRCLVDIQGKWQLGSWRHGRAEFTGGLRGAGVCLES